MPIEIAIPFALAPGGGIASTSDPNEQIRNHVMSLINTEPFERPVLVDYGVPLDEQLFENTDEAVATELADYITNAMAKWEPGVVIQSIAPVASETGHGVATVDVRYQRVDAPESNLGGAQGSNTNVAVIRIGGHVDEVVRG